MAGEMLKPPPMPDVHPLPAASVLLVREMPGGDEGVGLEVLMLRRHENSSFMPGAWVFPGGIVEPSDAEIARSLGHDSLLGTMRVAAVRETFEESGIWIGDRKSVV